jgi:hypothetical protein
MKKSIKSIKVKGYGNKKHEFQVELTVMSGYKFITVKKNGNPILTCQEAEYKKFKTLFK